MRPRISLATSAADSTGTASWRPRSEPYLEERSLGQKDSSRGCATARFGHWCGRLGVRAPGTGRAVLVRWHQPA